MKMHQYLCEKEHIVLHVICHTFLASSADYLLSFAWTEKTYSCYTCNTIYRGLEHIILANVLKISLFFSFCIDIAVYMQLQISLHHVCYMCLDN